MIARSYHRHDESFAVIEIENRRPHLHLALAGDVHDKRPDAIDGNDADRAFEDGNIRLAVPDSLGKLKEALLELGVALEDCIGLHQVRDGCDFKSEIRVAMTGPEQECAEFVLLLRRGVASPVLANADFQSAIRGVSRCFSFDLAHSGVSFTINPSCLVE